MASSEGSDIKTVENPKEGQIVWKWDDDDGTIRSYYVVESVFIGKTKGYALRLSRNWGPSSSKKVLVLDTSTKLYATRDELVMAITIALLEN